jgi:protocatechuate 3,4-dioxygenase beta subunit
MRLAPLILIAVILAGLAWFLWPDSSPSAASEATQDGAAAAELAAGTLGALDSPEVRREAAAGSLIVRVLDAQGRATAATVHGKVNGAATRLSTRDGVLTIPPPLTTCELMAEAGGAWSELGRWTDAGAGVKELVLRLEPATGASLRIHVSVEGEGPAAAPLARLTSAGRRGGIGEIFEGFEFRQDLQDREQAERAAAPPPPPPSERTTRERLLRENLANESWSGQNGLIEINSLLPGAWSFEITQAGCAPEFLDVELLPTTTEREVLLRRAGSVMGRVLGPDGKALAGAEVGLWIMPESELPWFDPLDDFERYGRMPGSIPAQHRGVTGSDGRFELPLVRPGTYDVLVGMTDLRPAVDGPVTVLSQQRADAGDVALRRGHSLRVRAVDPAGQPVPGALASWRAGETTIAVLAAGAKAVATDADGLAVLSALPGGEIAAEVQAAGFARARETFNFQDPPRTPQDWDVVLRAGAILPGNVSSGGLPVSGATVNVVPSGGSLPFMQQLVSVEATMKTGPDGNFRFESLPVGTWAVHVEHDDHSSFTSPELTLLEGENPPLQVDLAAGATLRVTVLDETGAPVAQAPIMAMESSMQAQENASTGPDGVAVLAHLRAGSWQVMRVNVGDDEPGEMPSDFEVRFEYVTLADGEIKDITLGGAVVSATLEGRITVAGAPQAGKMVILIGPGGVKTATSDADGQYKLEKVEVGDYIVTIATGFAGGSSWTGAIQVSGGGVQRHDLALPSSVVEIVVMDGASGDTLQGIPVNLRPEDSSSISGGMFQTTDGQGLARFEMLLPGSYMAAVGNLAMPMLGGGEGRGSAMTGGIRVASDNSGVQRVEVRLPEPAQLRLRVSGPDGSYLPGVHVFCLDEKGNALNIMSMKPTNSKGVVELSGLPPGLMRFVARHPDIGRAEFEVMLQAGQLAKQEVTLGTGVHVLLTVVNEKNEAIGGVMAVLVDARGHAVNYMFTMEETQALQQSFYSGSAMRIGPLTPGPYTVRLTRPGSAVVSHQVTVAQSPAEQPLRLRFATE